MVPSAYILNLTTSKTPLTGMLHAALSAAAAGPLQLLTGVREPSAHSSTNLYSL